MDRSSVGHRTLSGAFAVSSVRGAAARANDLGDEIDDESEDPQVAHGRVPGDGVGG